MNHNESQRVVVSCRDGKMFHLCDCLRQPTQGVAKIFQEGGKESQINFITFFLLGLHSAIITKPGINHTVSRGDKMFEYQIINCLDDFTKM